MMANCAIYIRVSTSDQNPENQEKELNEYCQNHKYDIFGTYIDRGESGLSDNRPAFNQLLEDMRRKRFKTLIVWKLDRIGRSLQHLLQILQEMQNKKVDLIVITQNIDTTTAAGKLLFSIMGAFAEFESSLISERTKLGMERARKHGKRIGRPKKDPKIYTHYCIVSGCRERIELTRKFCKKHRKIEKLLIKKEGK